MSKNIVNDGAAALTKFRHHLAKAGVILDALVDRARAEADGNFKKQVVILTRLATTDKALKAEVDAFTRLEKHVFPEFGLRVAPLQNPKPRRAKRRRAHAKKN